MRYLGPSVTLRHPPSKRACISTRQMALDRSRRSRNALLFKLQFIPSNVWKVWLSIAKDE